MKKNWKGILSAIIIIFLLITPLFLFGSIGTFSPSHAKLVYTMNAMRFRNAAEQVLEQGGADDIKLPSGVKKLDFYHTNSGSVDFYMGGFGLAPSTVYWGVVYTTEDAPMGWGGLEVDYIRDGEGWLWQEENSDNVCYVIKLDSHWYLYEMRF